MAVTIVRPTITDDSGGGTDGTIINAAWATDLFNRIDTALALLLPLAGGAMTGAITSVLNVTGFGTHSFSAGGTGNQNLMVRNTTAGAGNFASVYLGNDADAAATRLFSFSSTYTTSGQYVQDSTVLEAVRAGGLSVAASHTSGVIRFYSGGTTEWARLSAAGGFGLKDGITAPATVAGFALLYVDTADGDLKVKFGDGTVKTIVVDT